MESRRGDERQIYRKLKGKVLTSCYSLEMMALTETTREGAGWKKTG